MLKTALMQRYSPSDFECFCSFSTQKPLHPGQKPTALCNALRACLPSHVDTDEYSYFFINQFLSLLPTLTRAQCLASKFTSI